MPPHIAASHPEIGPLVIYEDRHVIAFDKPAGLAVQGGAGVTESLDRMLEPLAPRGKAPPRLAHRLDRETSGVIVAGRTPGAIAALNRAFADRRAAKTYLAIVCGGAPSPADGVFNGALVRATARGVDLMRLARPDEQRRVEAETAYETLAAAENAALLALRPRTGRMHQLRVHLAAAGRPIAGDGKYGGLFRIGDAEIASLLLHAFALDVPHPAGGRLQLAAPPPERFAAVARRLGLDHALPVADLCRRAPEAPPPGGPP